MSIDVLQAQPAKATRMIIKLNDDDDDTVDTDTASREELAKACVTIHGWWIHCGKMIDIQDQELADRGLSSSLEIADKEKALAWFQRALADVDED
jgi:hypothetical protein